MEAGPPMTPAAPHAAGRVDEREPLSLGEIRDVWPLLAHADRIEAFLLLPRDEAEDFFFALTARDQADVVLGAAGARAAVVDALPAARRRRRPDPGGAGREARGAAGAARRADPRAR